MLVSQFPRQEQKTKQKTTSKLKFTSYAFQVQICLAGSTMRCCTLQYPSSLVHAHASCQHIPRCKVSQNPYNLSTPAPAMARCRLTMYSRSNSIKTAPPAGHGLTR